MAWSTIETAPTDGDTVLFYDPLLGVIFGHFSEPDEDEGEESYWVFQDFVGDYVEGAEPTHWTPLPSKPDQ